MSKNILLIVVLFYISVIYSQQGNYKFNNFGNRSILLSGNVTGSVEDLGLVYYNPSRLTEVENLLFAFNAKAYQLTSLKLTNFIDDQTKLESTNFNGAATMAGGVFNLFGTRFAYSYLTKSRHEYNLNYSNDLIDSDITEDFPEVTSHNVSLGIGSKVKDDWSGLTWAYEVNDKLSLGISIFGSIYKYQVTSSVEHIIKSTENDIAFYENMVGFTQKSYGLFIKIGGNYHFQKFDLGININLPYLEVFEDGSFNYKKVIAGVGTDYNQFLESKLSSLHSKRKEPLGISIGAGIPINKSQIHINLDYVSGIKEYSRLDVPNIDTGDNTTTPVNFNETRTSVINFGVGAEIFLSDKFKSYFGFSTDFSANKSNPNLFDISTNETKNNNLGDDFYHLSTGVDWKLSWANIIFGVTYTKGSGEFLIPLKLDLEDINISDPNTANLNYNRWQFVLGLEIPFLDEKVNKLFKKDKQENTD